MNQILNNTLNSESLKILLVEDEPKVAAFIKKGLDENGFLTEIAYDGVTGKVMALSNKYQIIILDINLPLINGFQLCKIIRDINSNIPILMLTALSGIEEKSQGFEAGADDYLLKPFEVRELILRIKALIKRTNKSTPVSLVYQVANLKLYCDEKKVTRADKIINLSAKEYKLLEYMIINKNKVLDRLELLDHVWGVNFDTGTNVIDVYVNFLRKKVDNNFELKLIHTRIGMGYILSDEQK